MTGVGIVSTIFLSVWCQKYAKKMLAEETEAARSGRAIVADGQQATGADTNEPPAVEP